MSLDRIKQTVPVTGTGPIVLTGDAAPGGYKPFLAVLADGDMIVLGIVDQVTFDFEVSQASFNRGGIGGTLTRGDTISSSHNDIPVNFGGNACDVFVTHTAIVDPNLAAFYDLLSGLPTSPPLFGGLWNNGGVICITDVDAPTEAALAGTPTTLPTSPPAGGGLWNNHGVVCVA